MDKDSHKIPPWTVTARIRMLGINDIELFFAIMF